MSSGEYSTVLTPETRLRRWVVGSGAGLMVAGALIVLVQPIPVVPRLAVACAWLLYGSHRLVSLVAAYGSCRRIRVDSDGSLWIEAADGSLRAGRIGSGSIVLARIAWLRVVTDDRFVAGELLRGNGRECDAWRRFQVIWRHLGSAG